MSDGFLPFKGVGWGAGALLLAALVVPSTSSFNPLKTSTKTVQGSRKKTSSTPTPSPTPSPTPTTTTTSYPEASIIPSNFDISTELLPANMPPSNSPDVVGAFRFICNAGQILADDPIVYPGQPGKSHLHQFYGNTSANAYSTYTSLRQNGQSTCMSPVNRSAYWMPALLDGKGNVVRPDFVSIYYKRWPSTSPYCTQRALACVGIPNGLKFIMGRNMLDLSQPPTGNFHFLCEGVGSQTGYATMPEALAVCSPGHHLYTVIDAPMCWDGVNLDSPDHRSHVSYQVDTHLGYYACPTDHPYRIPVFTMSVAYAIVDGDDTSLWTFSSDAEAPNEPHGSTFHADYFEGWDNTVMAMWMDNCIEKLLNCAAGNLGNGYQMKQFSGFTWTANPRLVPIPS